MKKRLLSIVLVIAMLFSMSTVAFAAETEADTVEVATYEALVEALKDENANIVLTADIILTDEVTMNGGTLDGANFTITRKNGEDTTDTTNYGIILNGGILKNVTITGNAMYNKTKDTTYGFRALYAGATATGNVVLNNVNLSGTYALNITGKAGVEDITINATDSTFNGWCSGGLVGGNTFTGCEFEVGPTDYKTLRIYENFTLNNCDFAAGFEFSADTTISGKTLTLNGCTVDGVDITAANFAELFDKGDDKYWNQLITSNTVIVGDKIMVATAEALASALATQDADIVLAVDIVLDNEVTMNNGTLDGAKHSITRATKDGSADTSNYGIILNGGTIKNVTISGSAYTDSTGTNRGFRTLYAGATATGNVVLDNVDLSGTYALNITGKAGVDSITINATDSTFNGWCSGGLVGGNTFTDCKFAEGPTGYKTLRIYENFTLNNCEVPVGFEFSADTTVSDKTLTLNNCTLTDGTYISEINFNKLFAQDDKYWNQLITENAIVVSSKVSTITPEVTDEEKTEIENTIKTEIGNTGAEEIVDAEIVEDLVDVIVSTQIADAAPAEGSAPAKTVSDAVQETAAAAVAAVNKTEAAAKLEGTVAPENVKIKTEAKVEVKFEEVKIEASSDLPVAVTGNKTLVLNIEPVIAVTAVERGNESNTAKLGTAKVDMTGIPVEVTIPVPSAFAAPGEELTVIHTKDDGTKYYHDVVVDAEGNISFTNENGFSTFEIVATINTLEGIIENYEEVYRRAYEYADGEGYIDYVADVLGQVADAIESVDVDALDIPEEFKDELNAAAPIVVADIRELQADLATDEYATFAALVANGGDLVFDIYDDLLVLYDIAQSAGSDAYDLAVEIYEAEKAHLEQVLEDIEEQIRAEIEKIEGEIEEDIEDAKEDLENKLDEIVEIDVDLGEIKAIIAELEGIAGGIRAQIAALAAYTDGTSFNADIVALEAAVAAVEAYAGRLNAFVEAVEALADDVDAPKLSIEYVESVIAQAKAIAAEAEALVADAQTSVTVLVEVYEAVAPVLTELLAVVEEGSPVDGIIDTADETIGAFADTAVAGYEAVLAQLNASAANLEPVVSAAVDTVCGAVAVALDEITTATEIAASDIIDAVELAVETIKGEAQTFLGSTDDEIRAAGEQLLDLIETIDLALADVDYEEVYEEVEPVAVEIIEKLKNVTSIETAQAALTESLEVLETLAPLAEDLYDTAEDDVLYLLGRAEELATATYEIVKTAGLNIADDAVTAVENSAEAVETAAGTAIEAVETAIDEYELAVEKAAGIIIPVVTEAVEAISTEAAAIAGVTAGAVEVCIEKAQDAQNILDAFEYAIYDATHGEIALNCGEELDESKLIVVDQINIDDFVPYMSAQLKGLIANVIKTNEDLAKLLEGKAGPEIEKVLAGYGINLDAAYTAPVWDGFDDAALTARADIRKIVENFLTAKGVPANYEIDLGEIIKPILEAEFGLVASVDLKLNIPVVELLVEVADNVLYKYFTFATEFPAALDVARETGAHVVVVGMENNIAAALAQELAALPAEITGMIDLGAYAEYIDMVVDALNLHLFAYAAVNTNTTYVEDAADIAGAITIVGEDHDYSVYVKLDDNLHKVVCANDAAHFYTEAHVYADDQDTTCDLCGHVRTIETPDVPGPSGPVGGGGGGGWRCNGGNHCPSCQFTDLAEVIKSNPRIWWHEYTDYVIKNKLMNGMTDTLFMPNYTTTRAMLVTILWREAGSPVVDYEMTFEDVEANTWYTEAVRWAASKGIVDGMSDTEFAPNANITREQMVTIFYRYAKNNGVNVTKGNATTVDKFCDTENISAWAYDAVKWACGIKFVDGKENNNIDPTGNATRVEMATLIMRFIEDVM